MCPLVESFEKDPWKLKYFLDLKETSPQAAPCVKCPETEESHMRLAVFMRVMRCLTRSSPDFVFGFSCTTLSLPESDGPLSLEEARLARQDGTLCSGVVV